MVILRNTVISSQTLSNVSKIQEGKIGTYEKYTIYPFKIDYGFLPWILKQNQIGFNAYGRIRFNTPDTPVNAGLGIFFANPKEVTRITGGLALQFNDVFTNSPTSSVFLCRLYNKIICLL